MYMIQGESRIQLLGSKDLILAAVFLQGECLQNVKKKREENGTTSWKEGPVFLS